VQPQEVDLLQVDSIIKLVLEDAAAFVMFQDAIVARVIKVATAYQLITPRLMKKRREDQVTPALSEVSEALCSTG